MQLPPLNFHPIIRPMKEAEQTRRQPCANALATARAAQDAVAPDTVILFGSRARGDHRPDSDIDLLVIHREDRSWAATEAQRIGYAKLKQMSLRGEVNAIGMTRDKFNYARRAKNHVAAQALRDGVIMSGEKLDYTPDYDDGYPANWPDIRERLQAAHRNLAAFDYLIANPDIDQEIYGFNAQQSVENAIKGWLSAADLRYDRSHDLDELTEPLLRRPTFPESSAPLNPALPGLNP